MNATYYRRFMNPKTYFFIVLSFFSLSLLQAQKDRSLNSKMDELSRRTLIVIVEEPNRNIEKVLKRKPELLKRYHQDIEGYNRMTEKVFKEHWDYSYNVEFHSYADMISRRKEKMDGYAWVEFNKYRSAKYGHFSAWDSVAYDSTARAAKWTSNHNLLRFYLLEERYPIYDHPLPNLVPSEGDMISAVQQSQHYLKFRKLGGYMEGYLSKGKSRMGELAQKTLLFDGNTLSEELGDSAVGEVYGYPYKVVSWEVIEKAIVEKDAKYAYVSLQPRLLGGPDALNERPHLNGPALLRGFTHSIIDAADGQLLTWYNYSPRPKAFGTGWMIGKKQVDQYLEEEEGEAEAATMPNVGGIR